MLLRYIMRACVLMCMALVLPLAVMAQSSAEAKKVLDRAASVIEKSAGIEASFEFTALKQGKKVGSSTGSIKLKGDKFCMQTADAVSWFDGKTQWSYQKQSDEVTVSNPTAAELESVNPYKILSAYKSGYSYSLGDEKKVGGVAAYVVELKATDKKKSFSNIVIYIAKSTNLPLRIDLTMRDKSVNRIVVSNCKNGVKLADSTFTFNKKSYPNAEIIDLR